MAFTSTKEYPHGTNARWTLNGCKCTECQHCGEPIEYHPMSLHGWMHVDDVRTAAPHRAVPRPSAPAANCAPWIATTSGRRFDFSGPTPDMVDASDIVTASSRLFRFTGHGRRQPLDLNQHHMLVHEITARLAGIDPRGHQGIGQILRAALTHDAHEVYVGDVSRPLKVAMREASGGRSTYDMIEDAAQVAVLAHFGVTASAVQAPVIKAADNMALAWEARWLFGETWGLDLPPFVPNVLTPDDAAHRMFDVLTTFESEVAATPSDQVT